MAQALAAVHRAGLLKVIGAASYESRELGRVTRIRIITFKVLVGSDHGISYQCRRGNARRVQGWGAGSGRRRAEGASESDLTGLNWPYLVIPSPIRLELVRLSCLALIWPRNL